MSLGRIGKLIAESKRLRDIKKQAEAASGFSSWDNPTPSEPSLVDQFASGQLTDRVVKDTKATRWVSKQPDVGVRLDGDNKPRLETVTDIIDTEEGRKAGSVDNIRKVLKATSIGSTDAQRRAGGAIAKKLRKEVVEDYGRSKGWPKGVVRNIAGQAAKNEPGSEGAALAAKLLRVKDEKNLIDIATSKDYASIRDRYKEALVNTIKSKHGSSIAPDLADSLLEDIDNLTDIGLEALGKNYSRGIRGLSSYKNPSLTTALLASGEHTLDRLVPGAHKDLDAVTHRDLSARLGGIIEEASDKAGFTSQEETIIPYKQRGKDKTASSKIERFPVDPVFQDLLEELPNISGEGSMPSFTKPHKWTPKNVNRLVKTHDRGLKDLIAEQPEVLDFVNYVQSVPYNVNNKVLDQIKQLGSQGKLITRELSSVEQLQLQQSGKVRQQLQHKFDSDSWTGNERAAKSELESQGIVARLQQAQSVRALTPKEAAELAEHTTRLQKYANRKAKVFTQSDKVNLEQAVKIHDPLNRLASKRADELKTIGRAEAFGANGHPFYFRVELGDNGRTYFTTPLVNPQGSPVGRGVLQYANGHKLDNIGLTTLKTELASYLEYPGGRKIAKESVADRLQHFDDIEIDISKWASDPVEHFDTWAPLVDEKNQVSFINALNDYNGWKTDPNFKSHRITAMDAVTSGPQIIAALLDDHTIADIVQLVNSKTNTDLYYTVADNVKKIVDTNAAKGDPIAKQIQSNQILWDNRRKVFKRSVMVFPYGAGFKDMAENMLSDLSGKNWAPTKIEAEYLTKILHSNMEQIVPSLGVFKAIAKRMTDKLFDPAPDGSPTYSVKKLRLKSPTGFTYSHDYPFTQQNEKIQLEFGGKKRTLRPAVRQEFVGAERKTKAETALMAKFIHFLDATLLMKVTQKLKAKNIPITPVHDQFGVGPNNADDLLEAIKESMIDLFGGKKSEGNRLLEKLIEGATDENGNRLYDLSEFNDLISRGTLDIEETLLDPGARPFEFG